MSVSCTEKRHGLRSTTLKALARDALERLGRERATLSIVLTGDAEIRSLNRDFRESDQATDVLSFPLADPESLLNTEIPVFLGEIYISLDTARAQARHARRPLAREVAHLTVHGILHLLGYDHDTPASRRRMASIEARLLRSMRSRIAALAAG